MLHPVSGDQHCHLPSTLEWAAQEGYAAVIQELQAQGKEENLHRV